MINRRNYGDVNEHMDYLEEVRQNSPATLKRRWSQLRHLMEWAGETPLDQAHEIRPTFPSYLEGARNDGRDRPLAPATRKRNCGVARRYFEWAKRQYPRRYREIPLIWIDSLQGPKSPERATKRRIFAIEEVQKVLQEPPETLTDRRDRAAITFLFLSGARAGAFASLPIRAIDLERYAVEQRPRLGVRTKFGKSATTYLIRVPDLHEVVTDWDRLVRDRLSPDALWYATLTSDGMNFTGKTRPSKDRASAIRAGCKKLCARAGIPYYPPHSLRHGHAVYTLKRCKKMAELKAVSQNLMHSSLKTTEQIYGGLPNDEVGARIAALTQDRQSTSRTDLESFIGMLVQRIEEDPEVLEPLLQALASLAVEKLEGTS